MKYQPAQEALVAHLDGDAVVLHSGTHEYFRLNETAQVIWKQLENDETIEDVVAHLTENFDVSPDDARAEIEQLLNQLLDARLVVPAP